MKSSMLVIVLGILLLGLWAPVQAAKTLVDIFAGAAIADMGLDETTPY
jgi:hypothetical protein